MPNTFTPVDSTDVAGVPFLKGDLAPQEAMHWSSACWSLASAGKASEANRNAYGNDRFMQAPGAPAGGMPYN
jgi:hypothetical protein